MAEVGKRDKGIGERMRRLATLTIRTCYRSVCNHPFVVVMLLILFLMYRTFPFLFSLLVSASPVLVCTAILLGVLLSFGQPNIPEIEREESTTTTTNLETASLRTAPQNDATFVERDESFVAERFSVRRNDVVEKLIAEENYATGMISGVGPSLPSNATPIQETSREIQLEKKLVEDDEEEEDEEEEERGLDDSELEMKSGLKEEKFDDEDGEDDENQYSHIEGVEDENAEMLHEQSSPVGSFDSCMADRADSSPCSPWKRMGDEDDVDDEASDTGSDGAESSSPDASMADIIPMLDELHPLLDEDAPQPAQMSHDGSDAGSERSPRSSKNTNESDEDSDNQEDGAGEEDDDEHDEDDDDEEGEETQDEQNDAIKSAITWTETDQKNLMDLGTSELERNQRLESLIARRRARRMMTEKNLIDLDNFDLPFSVAPISTARRNPFDSSYDSHIPGLPPIPGSAPSIMLARSNPFDLPYDSSEEKPDLTGDNFQQEFVSLPPKEPFFRRHESFSVGPSFFGPPKQEKQETRFRPYFVPEHMASEGASYSSFERQLSELSDSKVSSVPETESVCSVGDQDYKRHIEEDLSRESELISHVEHPAEFVGHGSESSEDEHVVELGQVEKRDIQQDEVELVLGDGESHNEMMSSFSEPRDLVTYAENENGEVPLDTRPDEVNCSSRSSSSSLSESQERIFVDKEDEVSNFEPATADVIEDSSLPTQTSLEGSGLNINVGLVDQGQHIEPVYDTSPTSIQKNLSSSSISSDLLADTPRIDLAPGVVESEARESEVQSSSNDQVFLDSLDTEDPSVNSSPAPEPEESEGHMTKQDRSVQHEQIQVDSSTLNMNAHVIADPVANEKLLAGLSGDDFSEKPVLESGGRQPSLEKATFELHAKNHEDAIEPSAYQVDSIVEATDAQVHEKDTFEVSNEINQIDERILMELDVVGDFSVSGLESNSNEVETRNIEDVYSTLNRTEELPTKTEAQTGETDLRDSSLTETKIELPIAGARSMDDTEFKDAIGSHNDLHVERQSQADSRDLKDPSLTESRIELPIDRARSIDDTEFRDAIGSHTDLRVERQSKADSHDDGPIVAQVSKTRPLEGTSLNNKVVDGDGSDSKNESADSEPNQVGSSEEKKPATKSHKSSSRSSSSSSSSDSD